MLPIQIILNSVFDRESASICINGNVNENCTDVGNYSGNVNLKDSSGNNILSISDNYIVLGNQQADLAINVSNILLNQAQLNMPNGLVKLNQYGFIDNELLNLSFNPENLNKIQDIMVQNQQLVYFTVKSTDGTYKNVSLSQIKQFCQPKFIIIE